LNTFNLFEVVASAVGLRNETQLYDVLARVGWRELANANQFLLDSLYQLGRVEALPIISTLCPIDGGQNAV
jgi:hypothetical protein